MKELELKKSPNLPVLDNRLGVFCNVSLYNVIKYHATYEILKQIIARFNFLLRNIFLFSLFQ